MRIQRTNQGNGALSAQGHTVNTLVSTHGAAILGVHKQDVFPELTHKLSWPYEFQPRRVRTNVSVTIDHAAPEMAITGKAMHHCCVIAFRFGNAVLREVGHYPVASNGKTARSRAFNMHYCMRRPKEVAEFMDMAYVFSGKGDGQLITDDTCISHQEASPISSGRGYARKCLGIVRKLSPCIASVAWRVRSALKNAMNGWAGNTKRPRNTRYTAAISISVNSPLFRGIRKLPHGLLCLIAADGEFFKLRTDVAVLDAKLVGNHRHMSSIPEPRPLRDARLSLSGLKAEVFRKI